MHVAVVPDAPSNAADEARVRVAPPDVLPYNGRGMGNILRGTIDTMPVTDADIFRESADDSQNPPAPVGSLACAFW